MAAFPGITQKPITRREIFLLHLAGTLTLDLASGSWFPFPPLLLTRTRQSIFLFHLVTAGVSHTSH